MELVSELIVRYRCHQLSTNGIIMGSLNVRNLSDATHKALRIQAARHGRSTEAEVRSILDDAMNPSKKPRLGTMLSAIGREFDGVDLDTRRDTTPADPADLG